MPYYAEVDQAGVVERVVVAPSVTWVRDHLDTDGVWVKTTSTVGSDQYPGPGWTYDPAAKTFTAPPLDEPNP